jgi:2-polyprenyl-3-methyl-5-hydroxy-6-metoxy-1,4-benzoquinol methylase
MNTEYLYEKFKNRVNITPYRILNNLQYKYPKIRYFTHNILKIDINKIIIGDIHGINSYFWYKKTRDFNRLECPISNSPYCLLFNGEDNEYKKMVAFCIDIFGHYDGIKNITDFNIIKSKYMELKSAFKLNNLNKFYFPTLRQAKDSDIYEIIDGHHTIALNHLNGNKHVYAYVVDAGFSGMQKLLLNVSMTKRKELYQPIDTLTTKTWPVIRNCADRWEMIKNFLGMNKINQGTHLDLACSYGYFVNKFKNEGYTSKGLEIDEKAVEVGIINYKLKNEDFIISSIQDYLRESKQVYDITTCFSILHHFIINKVQKQDSFSGSDLIHKLSNITKKVMFLDTGMSHENWFKNSLKSWDEDHIIEYVMKHSDFKKYKILGKDNDNVGKYTGNYNRTVFAFYK